LDNIPQAQTDSPIGQPYELAGRGERFLAQLIDRMILIVVIVSFTFAILSDSPNNSAIISVFLILLLGIFIYQGYLLTVNGQTVGKLAMKIRIVDIHSYKNGGFVTNVLVRSIANNCIALVVPFYSIIDTCFIFSDNKRCLHDRLASTSVVKDK
jgi:uncharacterized RDD family membrane protein YckC